MWIVTEDIKNAINAVFYGDINPRALFGIEILPRPRAHLAFEEHLVLDEGAGTLYVHHLPSLIKYSSRSTSGKMARQDMSAVMCTYALLFSPFDMDSNAYREFRLRWKDAWRYNQPASTSGDPATYRYCGPSPGTGYPIPNLLAPSAKAFSVLFTRSPLPHMWCRYLNLDGSDKPLTGSRHVRRTT